ncbi:ribonuclease J [Vagococcus humatus]|uniref:Ribonuclease J n=1 Tax=Vagococcus humatus TaxID=1889241 RepID=A0A429Z9L2_9ENTE|nr:ribonuclease J [Vagococcus humatus]RST90380.1 RNase J family beta-CASP ribonuclease [Vagococcus humatus]
MANIKIIPLGGVRENGKNLYVVEVDDEIYVLDCGLKYPENDLLGIDIVIPDFTYLFENKEKIAGIFLTHGHADAIGALPYLLEEINVPVFGTELTIELAKLYVEDYNSSKYFKDFHVIDEFTEIDFEQSTISFFRTTHTIPDSVGVVIKTKEGSIVYTGDFKFDHSAIPMYQTDLSRLAEIGNDGVLALLSDSSNAENPVQVVSEKEIAEEVYDTLNYWDGRIIVASVASNIQRIQQVLDAADRANRKVVLTGQDLERIIRTAMKLGKLQLPSEDLIISTKQMKKTAPEELLILETGRMGEPIKALEKMAIGRHKTLNIQEGDLVYITTTPSIAMETAVAQAEDKVYRAGGTVKSISDNFRVSGHANPNDLKLMLRLMKPKYFVPVQGEYRMLAAHADLAHDLGLSYKDIYLTGRGDILEYHQGNMHVAGSTEADNILVDGIGVGDIGSIVLRDRKMLSEDGVFIVVTTINRKEKRIVSKPKISSRGFVYVKESKDLLKESATIVEGIVEANLQSKDFEWSKLKQEIREALSKYLFEQTKRRPVILPVIMETSHR